VCGGASRRTSRATHTRSSSREGVPLNIIQRQLGHLNLGVTSIYLQGIDPGEIIETIHARRPPMIPASADSSYGSEPERRGCRFSTGLSHKSACRPRRLS